MIGMVRQLSIRAIKNFLNESSFEKWIDTIGYARIHLARYSQAYFYILAEFEPIYPEQSKVDRLTG